MLEAQVRLLEKRPEKKPHYYDWSEEQAEEVKRLTQAKAQIQAQSYPMDQRMYYAYPSYSQQPPVQPSTPTYNPSYSARYGAPTYNPSKQCVIRAVSYPTY